MRDRAASLCVEARAAWERGERDGSLDLWREAMNLEPHEVHYAIEATNFLASVHEPRLALDVCTHWIARNPDNVSIRLQRGIIHANHCADRESAIECFAEALFIDPENHDAHAALAQIYLFGAQTELMRFHARQALIRAEGKKALHLRSPFLSDHAGVVEGARAMLASDPGDVDLWIMLGRALYMQGRFEEALDAFRRAAEIAPARMDATGPLGETLILLGRDREGWRELEIVANDDYVSTLYPGIEPYLAKRWRGEPLQGKRILVAYHAGIGDNLMLARYARRLQAAGAFVHFVCRPELYELMRNLAGADSVASGWRTDELAHFDYWALDYLLPTYLGVSAPDCAAGYIAAPPDARSRWSAFMQPFADKLKVGLCWFSGPHNFSGIDRFVPAQELRPLSGIGGIEWFVLQKNSTNAALMRQSGIRAHDLSSQWRDFADTAGLVEHLDLVISVDSSPLHLAGALGKPAWAILPAAPEWRWGLHGDRTEWYPEMRLYRQQTLHDWAPLISRIGADLGEMLRRQQASAPDVA
ncbi:tetratricopeptide repeat protein [Caballeronia arvi]|nr:tetratricopeptide repeat protein [Caballeronia arvi]